MIGHGLRQRIAEPRPAHVEPVAELAQGIADAARRGMLLVQNDQDRLLHDPSIRTCVKPVLSRSPAILEGSMDCAYAVRSLAARAHAASGVRAPRRACWPDQRRKH